MNAISRMLDLHDDIAVRILVRVSGHPVATGILGAVCRQWRRLSRSKTFLKQLMEHHGPAPLLGVFTNDLIQDRFNPVGEHEGVVGAPRFALPVTEAPENTMDSATKVWAGKERLI
jgi:hypothetical protein